MPKTKTKAPETTGRRDVNDVSPREFVEKWQTSTSLSEVAEKLSCEKEACQRRAHYFRKRGVKLKSMSGRSRFPIDWGELAVLAVQLGPQTEGEKKLDEAAIRRAQKKAENEHKDQVNGWQQTYREKQEKKKAKKKPAKKKVAKKRDAKALAAQQEAFKTRVTAAPRAKSA